MKKIAFLFLILTYCLFLKSQEPIPPLDIPLYLSGNFGELRSNHFHSGIDFKTQGTTGFPVKAVKNGYVSRIAVGPSGFGRAIYLNHPDGTMTVYGHVERFSKSIEALVVDEQYKQESFTINLLYEPNKIPVKQGEIIAYSGNSGSSGGPHLHFEIRDASGEIIMDPLPLFRQVINDNKAPEIRSLMFFPQRGKGVVNGNSGDQVFSLVKDKSGRQTVGKNIIAWGEIGIGIKAYDRMTGTSNSYGVKEIALKVDGRIIFHSRIDQFAFADTRYINSFISWEDWIERRSFHIKSFIEPGNQLKIYKNTGNGIININEEKIYRFEYSLTDAFGNKSVFAFNVTGKKSAIPVIRQAGSLYLYSNNNNLSEKGLQLTISKGNLYKDAYLKVDTINQYTPFSPLYRIREKAPLHSPCPLVLTIYNDTYPDKSKYGVVSITNGNETWMGGEYKNAKMYLNIRQTGDFAIRIDTENPTVAPVSPAQWGKTGRMAFTVKDNLSGIASWKGTLNEKFVLFEYDAKRNALFCDFDAGRMKKGKQKLELRVTDGAGNSITYKRDIIL